MEHLITPTKDTELQSQTISFRGDVKKRSDKLINHFLIWYFLLGVGFAAYYDTWLIAFGSGGLCLLAYYSVKIAMPGSNLYQYVLSVVFGIFMAQFIYQMHGLFEMHFFAFIGSAILITYQNWKLQIPMLLVVVVHHVGFGYLQNTGVENVYFTQLDYFELWTFIIHFVLAGVIFFVCGLWGYQLKKYSEKQIAQTMELGRLQKEAGVKLLEEQRYAAELDKAVAQGKFEIASDVMHDIGNAVVGFGSYLTRITHTLKQSNPENTRKLVEFFTTQKTAMTAVIGEAKADAVIKMLCSIALTERGNQEEIGKSITEQQHIISHIQEILHIQRQYITGYESQERKPVNLRDIINDCVSMLFGTIEKTGINVSLNIPAELPIIKGDRTKLMQVILNIIKNSLEAIDITQTEKTLSFKAHTNADLLILQIHDNGKGFDKSTADQLFGRGFTTKSSGSGLGLYNCRAIIGSHKGTIEITSEGVGKGAVTTLGFKV